MSEISILIEELAKTMEDLGISPLYLYEKDDKEPVKGELLDPKADISDAKPVKSSNSSKKNQIAVIDKEDDKDKKDNKDDKENNNDNSDNQNNNNDDEDDGDEYFTKDGTPKRYTNAFLSLIKELVELGTEWKNEKDIFEHSCEDTEHPDDKAVGKLLEVVNSVKKKLNFISEEFEKTAENMNILEQKVCYDIIEAFKIDICVVTTALQKIEENKKNSDKIETKPKEDKKKDDEKSTGTALVPTQTTGTDLVPTQSTGTALVPTQSTEVTTTSKEPEKKEKTGTALMTMSEYKTAVANSKQGFASVLAIGGNVITMGIKYLPELSKNMLEALRKKTWAAVYFTFDSIRKVWRFVMGTKVFLSDVMSSALETIKELFSNKAVSTAAGLMVGLAAFSPLGALLLDQKDLVKDFLMLPKDIVGIVPSFFENMKGRKSNKKGKSKSKSKNKLKKFKIKKSSHNRLKKKLKSTLKKALK